MRGSLSSDLVPCPPHERRGRGFPAHLPPGRAAVGPRPVLREQGPGWGMQAGGLLLAGGSPKAGGGGGGGGGEGDPPSES